MRRVVVFAALAGAVVLSGPPAIATPPENGGCPRAFTPLTEAEQLALAEQLGIPAELVEEVLDQVDRNADRALCFLAPRGDIMVLNGHTNIIDNTLAR